MKIFFLMMMISLSSSGHVATNSDKAFYLKQIDYRNRANFSVSLPGVRVRLRPFYEYRYRPKKKLIFVEKK